MRLLGAISEASGAFLEALGAAGSGFYVQKLIFGDFEMILDEFWKNLGQIIIRHRARRAPVECL